MKSSYIAQFNIPGQLHNWLITLKYVYPYGKYQDAKLPNYGSTY